MSRFGVVIAVVADSLVCLSLDVVCLIVDYIDARRDLMTALRNELRFIRGRVDKGYPPNTVFEARYSQHAHYWILQTDPEEISRVKRNQRSLKLAHEARTWWRDLFGPI